ncbi:VanZ family protein [Puniceicoccaceae bacterium K14]|nr:VanZ family protein [Puniceicoccaceae bacterium K14]
MNISRLYFFAVLLVSLYFGFKPFNFFSPNDVLLREDGTLEFNASSNSIAKGDSRGFIRSKENFELADGSGLSVYFDLTPLAKVAGLGPMLVLHDGELQPQLIIGQWRQHLAIRSRRMDKLPEKQYSEIGVRYCLNVGSEVELLLSSDKDGTTIYLNSEKIRFEKGFELVESAISSQLVVGSDGFGGKSWKGLVRRLAIYDKAITPGVSEVPVLDYRFEGANALKNLPSIGSNDLLLYAPKRFSPVSIDYLAFPNKRRQNAAGFKQDVILNTIGLIPLGMAFFFWLRSFAKSSSAHFVACLAMMFGFSLLIETLQIFLPTRNSSSLDLLLNTVSGILAYLLCFTYLKLLKK